MRLTPLGSVGLELMPEVHDEEHGREIYRYLEESGYSVKREFQGDSKELIVFIK